MPPCWAESDTCFGLKQNSLNINEVIYVSIGATGAP